MDLIQHFIVEGKYLGQAMRTRIFIHGESQEPKQYAYFCPQCGEVWARCPIDNLRTQAWWFSIHLPCRKHRTSRFVVPGALSLAWEPEFAAVFPPGVVAWEFQRHLDYAEGVS